jgi:hypothetical protein
LFYQCPLDTTLSGTAVLTSADMKVLFVGAAENPYGLNQTELDKFVALNNELNNATNYSK